MSNQILSKTDINKRIRRHARSCSRARVVHSNSHARLPFVQMLSQSLVTPLTLTPPLPSFTDTKTHTHYFCATEKRVALLFLPSPALLFFFYLNYFSSLKQIIIQLSPNSQSLKLCSISEKLL